MFFATKRYVDEQIERQRIVSNAALHALTTSLSLVVARSPTGDAILDDLKVIVASEVGRLEPPTVADQQAYRDALSMVLQTMILNVSRVRGALRGE